MRSKTKAGQPGGGAGDLMTLEAVRLAFEVTPIAIMLADSGGVIRLTNAEFDLLFGYAPGALVGRLVEELLPEDKREGHVPLRDAFAVIPAKRRMGADRAITGQTASGMTLPLDLALEPVVVGDAPMVIVTALDLRTRVANKERIGAILDAASSAMLVVDDEGRIEFVNKAITALLGHDPEALLGQPVEFLVPPEIRRGHPVYRRSFASMGGQRAMGRGRTISAWHKDGHAVNVEGSLSRIELEGEARVVVTLVDLSERIAAEVAMAARTRELERLNSDLEQFNRGISHDLKAPLTSISGLISLCQEDLEAMEMDELRENLGRAQAIAERSIGDIEDLLRLALIADHEVTNSPVLLEPMIQDLWEDLSGDIKHLKLDLSVAYTRAIVTEEATLRSILRNLMSNAIRYRDRDKPGLELAIDVRAAGEFLTLTVADNGIGIPEDFLPEMFDLFKRLGDRGGSGVGLNLVHRNIERLGGRIAVSSTLGEGSVFTVHLPILKEQGA